MGDLLSKMMKSPVLVVPSLADAPDSMVATVYVFQNGVPGLVRSSSRPMCSAINPVTPITARCGG